MADSIIKTDKLKAGDEKRRAEKKGNLTRTLKRSGVI